MIGATNVPGHASTAKHHKKKALEKSIFRLSCLGSRRREEHCGAWRMRTEKLTPMLVAVENDSLPDRDSICSTVFRRTRGMGILPSAKSRNILSGEVHEERESCISRDCK